MVIQIDVWASKKRAPEDPGDPTYWRVRTLIESNAVRGFRRTLDFSKLRYLPPKHNGSAPPL